MLLDPVDCLERVVNQVYLDYRDLLEQPESLEPLASRAHLV